MLLGLLGQAQRIAQQGFIVINAVSVVEGPRGPLPDIGNRNQPYEKTTSFVVTFTRANPIVAASTGSMLARIEWGAHGAPASFTIPIYPGLVIPVRGSWIRVTVLPVATAAEAYDVAAFLAEGEVAEPPAIQLCAGTVAAGAAASFYFDPLFSSGVAGAINAAAPWFPFINAIKLAGFEEGGGANTGAAPNFGPNLNVTLTNANTSRLVVYDLMPGATDVWHPVAGALQAGFVNFPTQAIVWNRGALTAEVTLYGRLAA